MPIHLPTEILTHIFAHFLPLANDSNDSSAIHAKLQNLSRICQASRALRHVAEPLLYRHLHQPTLALLQTLCRRPELGSHVRHVDYHEWQRDTESCLAVERLRDERIRGFARDTYCWPALDWFLRHMLDFEVDDDDDDHDDQDGYDSRSASVGPQTVLLTMILCLTPRVEVLHLDVDALDDDEGDTLSELFELCGRHVLGAARRMKKTGHVAPTLMTPLCSLRELRLRCWTSHGEPSRIDKSLYPLIFFPSLVRLDVQGLDWIHAFKLELAEEEEEGEESHKQSDGDDKGANNETWPSREILAFPGSHTQTTYLSLSGCNPASVASLREILLVFPSLRTLVLEFWLFESRRAIDLTQYGHVLRERGDRLRRFEFETAHAGNDFAEQSDIGAIGSLRGCMKNLDRLRLPLAALVGSNADGLDLCTYLPTTLRWFWTSVTMTGDAEAHNGALANMLEEAARGNAGRLPCLDWVMVQAPRDNEGPRFAPQGFEVFWRDIHHVLYARRPAASICNLPGSWAAYVRLRCIDPPTQAEMVI